MGVDDHNAQEQKTFRRWITVGGLVIVTIILCVTATCAYTTRMQYQCLMETQRDFRDCYSLVQDSR